LEKITLHGIFSLQKLREELLTLNGEEAEAADHDSEEDEKGTIHKLLGRKYCI
jgi:chromosome condensin MukBEF MukE localization factor